MNFRILIASSVAGSVLVVAGAILLATAPSTAHAADCTAQVQYPEVKSSCLLGGQNRVKIKMNAAMDSANNSGSRDPFTGLKWECKSCHLSSTDFRLNSRGRDAYLQNLRPFYSP